MAGDQGLKLPQNASKLLAPLCCLPNKIIYPVEQSAVHCRSQLAFQQEHHRLNPEDGADSGERLEGEILPCLNGNDIRLLRSDSGRQIGLLEASPPSGRAYSLTNQLQEVVVGAFGLSRYRRLFCTLNRSARRGAVRPSRSVGRAIRPTAPIPYHPAAYVQRVFG